MKNIIYVGIIVFALFYIFGGLFGSDNDSSSPSSSNQNEKRDNSTMAYVQAKNYVKEVLKSPSSADFPFAGSGTKIADDTYEVTSYVDSQNSYGAMLRNNYSITLKYNGGNSADPKNWSVEKFIFDGEDLTQSMMSNRERKIQACMDQGETRSMCEAILKAF